MPVEWVLRHYEAVKQEGGSWGPPLVSPLLGMTAGSGNPKFPQRDTCAAQTPRVLQTNSPAKKKEGWERAGDTGE